jgi:lipoprotein signal peptidase
MRENAVFGFNILGLFFTIYAAAYVFVGVAFNIMIPHAFPLTVPVPYLHIFLILLPILNFAIAYGFKKNRPWAWHVGLIALVVLLINFYRHLTLGFDAVFLTIFLGVGLIWLVQNRNVLRSPENHA